MPHAERAARRIARWCHRLADAELVRASLFVAFEVGSRDTAQGRRRPPRRCACQRPCPSGTAFGWRTPHRRANRRRRDGSRQEESLALFTISSSTVGADAAADVDGACSCEAPLRNVTRGVWRAQTPACRSSTSSVRGCRATGTRRGRFAGRHVVMLGHDAVRHVARPPPRAWYAAGRRSRGSVCWERSWAPPPNQSTPRGRTRRRPRRVRQWAHFFHGTNALFSSAGGREVCDCSRPSMAAPHQENRAAAARSGAHRSAQPTTESTPPTTTAATPAAAPTRRRG